MLPPARPPTTPYPWEDMLLAALPPSAAYLWGCCPHADACDDQVIHDGIM